MKIKEIYIRKFGKLMDYKLTFSDGMNVVFGNNEAGKTTVFNFILAMLYGFSNTRGKGIYDSARKKYMTWGENRIGGTMTVEHNGTTYVIDRVFGKTKAGDSLEFTNLTLGEAVNLPSGKEVGEYLFDLDEKSFRGTCFIGQLSKDDVCDNDSVKTKLSNLSSVGDAEYSFDDVFNRLKVSSLEITRKTSTGKIYPLENKKNEFENRNRQINSELNEINNIDAENSALEEKTKELKNEASKLEILIDRANKYKIAAEYKKAVKTNDDIDKLYVEYQNSEKNITRNGFTADRNYIDDLNSLMKKRDEAKLNCKHREAALKNEETTLKMLSSKNETTNKSFGLLYALSAFVAVIVSALLFVVFKSFVVSGVVLAVALIVIACVYFATNRKKKSELKSVGNNISLQNEKLQAAHSQFEASKEEYERCNNAFTEQYSRFFTREEIDRAEENIKSLSAMVDSYIVAKNRYDAVKSNSISSDEIEKMREGIDEASLNDVEAENIDLSKAENRKNYIVAELSDIEKKLIMNKAYAKDKGKLQTELEDNLAVMSEIDEKIRGYEYAKDCLELAKQGLEKAQSQMQQQFAPEVSRRVSEILSEITCGKYEQMTLNSNLNTMVVDNESGAAYDDGYMSAGTLDQIYLSLRLAMINQIFAEKEYPVICMDDALLNFDFNRMKKATEYISHVLAKEAQILFFTCRDTEKACFSDAKLISI